MTKDKMLYVRVTKEFNERLETVVSMLPGDKSDVMRFALEEFVNKQMESCGDAQPRPSTQIEPPLLS